MVAGMPGGPPGQMQQMPPGQQMPGQVPQQGQQMPPGMMVGQMMGQQPQQGMPPAGMMPGQPQPNPQQGQMSPASEFQKLNCHKITIVKNNYIYRLDYYHWDSI